VEWRIERVRGTDLDIDEVAALYGSSGLGARRPVADRERFTAMVRNADLILVARTDDALVGIARCISDFSYATYLSDLAVSGDYQRCGIGRALIAGIRQEAPIAKIVLLSAPAAADYYPHVGFARHSSAWVLDP
jgi:ribosomal protein S18 acetylase RimI-like enzyme